MCTCVHVWMAVCIYVYVYVYVYVILVTAAGFLSRYLNGPLSYVQRHITVNKMC